MFSFSFDSIEREDCDLFFPHLQLNYRINCVLINTSLNMSVIVLTS
jgi:hypothetical protein